MLRLFIIYNMVVASFATVAIFGASGKTGSECVYQALSSGVNVIALVRNPDKLRIPLGSGGERAGQLYIDLENKDKVFEFPGQLTVVTGDVTNPLDVKFVFESDSNIDSVIVALGGRTKDVGLTMLTNGTSNIVNSMLRRELTRIAVVTSVGAGDSIKQSPWSFWILMMTVMRNIMTDKNNQEGLFLLPNGIGHNLEYCIIRPGQLGEGPPTGIVNVNNEGKAGAIQRADLAAFALKAVSDFQFPYLQTAVSVSSIHGTSWVKAKIDSFDAVTSNKDL